MLLRLRDCLAELRAGEWVDAHAALYGKYFVKTEDKGGKVSFDYNDEAIRKAADRHSGFLCLLTDDTRMDAQKALSLYRDKDGVEKVFGDCKNANDFRRLGVHSREAMDGKLFVLFLTSVLTSELRQRMKAYKESPWTLSMVRASLDKLCVDTVKSKGNGSRSCLSIITKAQRLYLAAILKKPEKEIRKILFPEVPIV